MQSQRHANKMIKYVIVSGKRPKSSGCVSAELSNIGLASTADVHAVIIMIYHGSRCAMAAVTSQRPSA
jgi:hypothetical protein